MRSNFSGTSFRGVRHAFALALGLVALSFGLVVGAEPAGAAAPFVVNSTGDQEDANISDAACDVNAGMAGDQCTLRAAIEEANNTTGADAIDFDISGSGVRTIAPVSDLPTITEEVTIDGYSQPGAEENTLANGNDAILMIELDGTVAGDFASGLTIQDARFCVVRGLAINRFKVRGIDIFSSSSLGAGHVIEGNFVGTDPAGQLDLGNGEDGIAVFAPGNTIGGTSPAARNVISGNPIGVFFGTSGTSNRVEGNYIGTTKSGTGALGNSIAGVNIGGSNNTIGGPSSGAANAIAFNGFAGVYVSEDATGNRILGNAIFSNGSPGIDLITDGGGAGSTPNDEDDADTDGGNNLQNYPVLTSAKTGKRSTTVKGTLNSTPGQTFTVQFFSNPSGTDQGKTFIGETTVTTDVSGDASFTFKPTSKVTKGQNITATATNTATGDTSEFSAPRKVTVQKRR